MTAQMSTNTRFHKIFRMHLTLRTLAAVPRFLFTIVSEDPLVAFDSRLPFPLLSHRASWPHKTEVNILRILGQNIGNTWLSITLSHAGSSFVESTKRVSPHKSFL